MSRGGHSKVWVVREGDGPTLLDVVKRAGEPASAFAEGRVFLGRVRAARADARVKPGDEVTIGPAPRDDGPSVRILHRGGGLCAVAKPAGLPTVPDHAGAAHSLVGRVARAIGVRPGDLRVTSRLDREVSGVVVFAETEEAEARLRRARERGRYARRYLALSTDAAGALPADGTWDAPIGRGRDARHRSAHGEDGKPSRTRFRVVARMGDVALLAVEPETGRTHQIRVHASHAGAPLLGDRDYGGPTRLTRPDGAVLSFTRIALHAARVRVPDADNEDLVLDDEVPAELGSAWRALGGDAAAWDIARTCAAPGSPSPPP